MLHKTRSLLAFCIVPLTLTLVGCRPYVDSQPVSQPDPQRTSSVDLRPKFAEYGLGPRQQGKRGACQVFAFVGVLEYELARAGTPAELSEQYLMWAANESNGLTRTEGFNPDYLIKGLQKHGIADEQFMPYVDRNEPLGTPTADASANARRRLGAELTSIKHWSSPIGFTDDHLSRLRDQLDGDQPVTVTFCWPFGVSDRDMVTAEHFMIDKGIDGSSKDGHGVILVGYGLDASVPGGGYFWFRNSWGTGFAAGGYGKIDFKMAKKYGTDAYFVTLVRPR
jgi:Papain family cysteine protease